jgi:penicillin-binding protein 2
MIDTKHYSTIVDGMYKAVHEPGGTAVALGCLPGLELCGKTGTAQNPQGKDHSTFLGFAPKNDPKIAISVYVENGGFGGTIAVPIASLIVEKYLTDTITRPHLVDYVKNMKIAYPYYDNKKHK